MQGNGSSTHSEEWRIRHAEPRDTLAITHLCEQLGYPRESSQVEHQLALLHSLDHHAVLIAESDQGQVLGWVHIFERPLLIQEAGAELGGLVVEKSVREAGVGRALMQKAESWARERNLKLVTLRSNTQRMEAHAFYLAIGYTLQKTSYTFRKSI